MTKIGIDKGLRGPVMRNVSGFLTHVSLVMSARRLCIRYNLGASTFFTAIRVAAFWG
jgi:hypothetical protein